MTMKKNDIKDATKEFIVNNYMFSRKTINFNEKTSFFDTGIIDSTGILELIEFIEDNFDIIINNDEIIPENLDSVQKVTDYVLKKMNN